MIDVEELVTKNNNDNNSNDNNNRRKNVKKLKSNFAVHTNGN